MSFTTKDVINEAMDRCGIWPNPSDSLPGEYFDQGLKVLKGLIHTFNIRNYITCTQRSVLVDVPADCVIHMTKSEPGPKPFIDDVTNVTKVYWQNSEGVNTELKYVSFMEFPGYMPGNYIHTWNQVGEYSYDVILQSWMRGKKVLIMYNVPFECERDTVYYLPPEYNELFILGLCVKLLAIYPREDKQMLENMGQELGSIIGSIEAKQTSAKILEYNRHDFASRQAAFGSGSFLGVWDV